MTMDYGTAFRLDTLRNVIKEKFTTSNTVSKFNHAQTGLCSCPFLPNYKDTIISQKNCACLGEGGFYTIRDCVKNKSAEDSGRLSRL